MRKRKILFFLIIVPLLLFGENDDPKTLRNSCLRDIMLPYSSAALFLQDSWIGGSFENRYCVAQLMKGSCFFALRKKNQLFYSEVSCYGFTKMNETNMIIGYHRSFAKKIAIGVNFRYLMEYAEAYQILHSFVPSFNLTAWIGKNLILAIFVDNPVCMKYGVRGQQLIPILFSVRLSYFFGERAGIWAGCLMKIPADFDFHIGTDIHIKPIVLGLGVGKREVLVSCKLPIKSFAIDVVSQYDFLLGYSPKLIFYYHF